MLAGVAGVPSRASTLETVITGILKRVEGVEDKLVQLQAQGPQPTTRNRTTVNKVELSRIVAEWMVRTNKLGINKIDPDQVWQGLKSQGVVVHSTYQNFRLWFKRNKDRVKAEVKKA